LYYARAVTRGRALAMAAAAAAAALGIAIGAACRGDRGRAGAGAPPPPAGAPGARAGAGAAAEPAGAPGGIARAPEQRAGALGQGAEAAAELAGAPGGIARAPEQRAGALGQGAGAAVASAPGALGQGAEAAVPSAPGAPRGGSSAVGHAHDLIEVSAVIPDAVLDLRYATAHNFMGAAVYARPVCKLRRAVADRLARAAAALRAQDRRLVLWDCYRPTAVQARMWRLVPDPRYVASPRVGSRHNRGAAVDVAIADRAGALLPMPTDFDDFSEAAHRERALAGPRGAEARRLEEAMTGAGFRALRTEWWHFDAPESAEYALSSEPL
jgi:D-alanyl-D-alanine dipeptidase